MIRIRYLPEEFSVTITGHAGSDEPGKDLVCCAVSTIAQCMVHDLEALHGGMIKKAEYKVQPGNFHLRVVPCEYRRITIRTIYDTFINSLQYVADNYPEYVDMGEEKNGD